MPKVSIILPLYNGENHVLETLDRLLGQSFTDFELIVVDDQSTDQSPRLIKGKNDPRIRLFPIPHAGTVGARVHGLEKSTGEFISFCDQDDLWTMDKLQIQLREIGDADLIYSDAWILESGQRVELYSKWLKSEPISGGKKNVEGPLFRKNPIPNSTVLFKRKWISVLKDIIVDPSVCLDLDYSLWLEMVAQGAAVKFLEEPLMEYRIHEAQQSMNTLHGRRWREFVHRKFLDQHSEFKRNYPFLVRRERFMSNAGLFVSNLKEGHPGPAFASFMGAIRGLALGH